ncbi:hypothetical protein FPZ24_05375 [Sphingomonas panacisoli]|uniref:DUF2029 domain-containing protein n=1 Tax=Sphingomonas panacisoli TaxID=1813879 RepID=A0A5B8LIJ9_9SPHN|nr:hypothetical protein [Sphingomonas panacisoli]QDZ06980.1 hypothetical protein FPZ24_05375 [Sphingomonas panacisoli]
MAIWLAEPSRFAALSKGRARVGLALLLVLLAATLSALLVPQPAPVSGDPAKRGDDQTDVVLYETIVDGVRHGGNYYEVAAQELRAGDYPMKPFVTFRLPTLAMVQALMPAWAVIGLLYALAAGVILAWFVRLRPAFARPPPLIVAMVLLAGGMGAFVQSDLAAFHEVWAGLLIALSLALRRPGGWVAAAGIGALAMLIRETAALYVAIMVLLAILEGERKEAAGWTAGVALLAIAVLAHAHAVAQVVRPFDPASPGWAGMLGFGFFVEAMTLSTALRLAPLWLAALLMGFTLFGWAAWRDGTGIRAFATFCIYAVLISLFGRVDTFYWGLMVAPAILIGLAFVPDGLKDLIAAAFPKRRKITVTRITP